MEEKEEDLAQEKKRFPDRKKRERNLFSSLFLPSYLDFLSFDLFCPPFFPPSAEASFHLFFPSSLLFLTTSRVARFRGDFTCKEFLFCSMKETNSRKLCTPYIAISTHQIPRPKSPSGKPDFFLAPSAVSPRPPPPSPLPPALATLGTNHRFLFSPSSSTPSSSRTPHMGKGEERGKKEVRSTPTPSPLDICWQYLLLHRNPLWSIPGRSKILKFIYPFFKLPLPLLPLIGDPCAHVCLPRTHTLLQQRSEHTHTDTDTRRRRKKEKRPLARSLLTPFPPSFPRENTERFYDILFK